MTLEDFLKGASQIIGKTHNLTREGLTLKYFLDAEYYRGLGHEKVYKMIRKICVESYASIDNPESKERVRQQISKYLPKKEHKHKA